MIPWPDGVFNLELIKGDKTEVIDIPEADHYSLLVEAFNKALIKGDKEVISHLESLSNLNVLDRLRARPL